MQGNEGGRCFYDFWDECARLRSNVTEEAIKEMNDLIDKRERG